MNELSNSNEERGILEELKKLNPKTALDILKSKKTIERLIGAPAIRPPPDMHDRLKKAIDEYDRAVEETISRIRQTAALDVAYISVTLILLIAAAIWSNLEGIITSLGLGGLSAASQGKAWVEAIRAYLNDTKKLEISVRHLRSRLDQCPADDMDCLNNVRKLLDEYWEALATASSSG